MLDFLLGRNKKNKNNSVNKSNSGVIYANEYVVDTFLTLTTKTYPYMTEDELVEEMIKIKVFPQFQKDAHGNYFYKIGESRTMFTSHLDTASRDQKPVSHIFEKNMVKTNGDTILGADDKAGVTIMLYMIKNNVPGLYYFFIGEEVGCVGSGLASKYINFKGLYDRCISFDRRGTDSVITHQSSTRCCSDDFAKQLAAELNRQPAMSYKTDDSGVYTDSAEFTSDIPECTNISVGYYKEHTVDESQDIQHLSYLAEACVKVNWESLVTKRDPSKVEYKSWSNYGTYGGGYGYNKGYTRGGSDWRNRDDYGYGWGSYGKSNNNLKKAYGYYDDFYEDDVKKSTRRAGKKNNKGNKGNARTFYSSGSDLIPMGEDVKISSNSKYEWIKFKFLEGGITRQELVVIRDQYLDMDKEEERKFYEIIESYVL